jgi:hypothetical protein
MPSPSLTRDQLAKFLPDQQAIKEFERLLKSGSLALQDADTVTITGGAINGVAIGATSASSGKFTTLAASGQITSTVADGTPPMVVTSTTEVANLRAATAATADNAALAAVATVAVALQTARTIGGVSFDGTASITVATATGSFTVSLGFGCNGKTAQTAAASGGAVATTGATNAVPFGYTTAAQADDIVTKLNAIRAALVANGIMS